MTYWKSQHFLALQKAWYGRLKDVGFNDAEEMVAGEMLLRQPSSQPYKYFTDAVRRELKEEYYLILSQMACAASFVTEIDQLIMTRHAEGHTIKFICDELKALGTSRCRGTVRVTIRKYEMKWGMRHYTPQQLNRKKPA